MAEINQGIARKKDESLEGCAFRPANFAELWEAIDQAFDYRGDVTLELESGEKIVGYVYNRNVEATAPYLQIYPKGNAGTLVVSYADIAAIVFSGEDTASGKSWEAWVSKKISERKAEAARLAAAAQARGHL